MPTHKHIQRLCEICEEHGLVVLNVAVDRHVHLMVQGDNGKTRKLHTSSTPSTNRAIKQFAGHCRKVVRDMGADNET